MAIPCGPPKPRKTVFGWTFSLHTVPRIWHLECSRHSQRATLLVPSPMSRSHTHHLGRIDIQLGYTIIVKYHSPVIWKGWRFPVIIISSSLVITHRAALPVLWATSPAYTANGAAWLLFHQRLHLFYCTPPDGNPSPRLLQQGAVSRWDAD